MGQSATTVIHAQPVTLAERPDFHVIGEIIQPGSRVLDLGCGEGELLAWLMEHKRVLDVG
jgi:2-polyprenyl-3-methyl-5-hydroxy-6-metoxy-1,4-benzoquinol methylase